MSRPPKPIVIDADTLDEAPSVEDAPPIEDAPIPQGTAMLTATGLAARRPSRLSLVFWIALALLIALAIGTSTWGFVAGLLASNALLGQIALGLTAIVGLGVLIFLAREIAGIARLSRLDGLRQRAEDPATLADIKAAQSVATATLALYTGREALRLPAETLRQQQAELLDPDALLDATETALLTPLDAAARSEVEQAARQVATATAIVPLAFADVAIALVANLRMIRRIAEVYGGRAGTLGSWRLLRSVARHLIATGAVALGDDLIGSVIGGGAVAKLSRRMGEGVVNGALTARVGIAAMEVCRPLPFRTLPKPKVTRLLKRALTGLFSTG